MRQGDEENETRTDEMRGEDERKRERDGGMDTPLHCDFILFKGGSVEVAMPLCV